MSEPRPDSPSREERINKAIADYLTAAQAGQRPDPREWLDRFSDVADELRSFFSDRDGFLAFAGGPPSADVSPTPRTSSSPPVSLGDYELLEELGRGGMGVVYRARQSSLPRQVALKLLLDADWASPDEQQRFRREAEVVARLEHPHIVPVYEAGLCDGLPYLSMKLIEGGNLARAVAAGRWPVGEKETQRAVAALLVKIARAVHHAHQRGVLHRDLKPANVLLDEQGQPHVTDFGLARRLSDPTYLTPTGTVIGTPCYMAPEQAAGAKDVTTAVDVYSLGAILYELLTGRRPFEGESVLETLLRVQEEEPARPRTLNRRIDRDLESVCLKCLEKDPRRRYRSAEALANDLEGWLRGESVPPRPTRRIGRFMKWVRRRPAIATLLALCLLTVLAVSVVFLRQSRAEADLRRTLTELSENERKERKRVDDERNFRSYLDAVRAAAKELENTQVYGAAPNKDPRRRARELLDSCTLELRSAEWYCLDSLLKEPTPADPSLQRRLEAHDLREEPPAPGGGVLSPDGRFRFHEGAMYSVASGRQLFRERIYPFGGRFIFLGFSKDSQRFIQLAPRDYGTRVTIWETSTGQNTLTLSSRLPAHCFNQPILLLDGELLAFRLSPSYRGLSGRGGWETLNLTRSSE
jgi:serine/threonine protein kinase